MSSTALIDALFMRTVDIVQSLPKAGPIQTSYEEKLALYSLYKQATEGDVNFTRPGMFDMLGRAKWDAWAKRKGLPSRDAKQLYVESMLAILRRFSDRPQAIALIEELESFSGDVEQQIMDGSFAQDDESEDTPPRAASASRRTKAQGRGKEARRPAEISDDEDEEEDDDDEDEDDDDEEDEDEDEEELDEAETYRRTGPGGAGRPGVPPGVLSPPGPSTSGRQGLPPQAFYGRYGGNVTGGGPPSSWSQQSFTGPGNRPPSVTGGMRGPPPPAGSAYYGSGGGGGGRAPSVAGTSFSGAAPPGVSHPSFPSHGGGVGQHSMSYYSTASHAHAHAQPHPQPQQFRGSEASFGLANLRNTAPPAHYAPSSVGGRSVAGGMGGGPRSEAGQFPPGALIGPGPIGGRAGSVTGPMASSVTGGASGAMVVPSGPAAGGGATPTAAAAAPLRPEVDLALQSIQASLAALHERLNRVESSGRDAEHHGSVFSQLFRGTGGAGRGGTGANGDRRQRGALGSAYAGFADAFHDIAVLLGFRRGHTRPGATPSFYQTGGAGGANGSGGGGNAVLTLAVRLGLAAVNLAVRLALDVTSVVILLSLLLTLTKRLTGRGDPLLLLRLIRRWTGVRPRTLIAATTSAAAAVAGGSVSGGGAKSGRAVGGSGGGSGSGA
ncbi:hypothetical protein OC844_007201 [Tilletia horrida]|nr:hypothetical protein OC844_007201 [Tilletia horrida]